MKTAGMIGGLGPESTIAYYRGIVKRCRARARDGPYPSLIIDSLDLTKVLTLVAAGRLDELARYLGEEIRTLASAGADFAFIAANTPHVVFDRVRSASPIPLISVVEAVCEHAGERKLARLAIFGTRFTMEGSFYREVFSRSGIMLVAPDEDDRSFVHEAYLGELVNGIVLPRTRERFLGIVDRLREQHAVDGVVLGGTELTLLLHEGAHDGLPLLDSAAIHVERVVTAMLA